MKKFQLEIKIPAGTVLVGGYSATPEGLDAVHASDKEGRPLLPSTAIRGALRETLEGLLRAVGQETCSGGDGYDPSDNEATASAGRPCVLGTDGGPCKACQIFGTRTEQVRQNQRSFSALVLGNATLKHHGNQPSEASALSSTEADWNTRFGVSLDRQRRSAKDKLLFNRRLPRACPDLCFVAEGRFIPDDEALFSTFAAAVTATTHLGGGRSRGYGRIECNLAYTSDSSDGAVQDANTTTGDVWVRVCLESPANIGVPLNADNLRRTRNSIPGAAVRGAIGFALAETLGDPEDSAFQALVNELNGATFDFFYPCEDARDGLLGPWPLTARACKHHPTTHGLVDTLLNRIAVRHAQNAEEARRVRQTSSEDGSGEPVCTVCRGALKGAPGSRGAWQHPSKRTVTRVALDRKRSSALHGALFSHELLETGTVFAGTVRNIPAAQVGGGPSSPRARLQQALCSPLSFGRGRSMGWGCVKVETAEVPPATLPLRERAEAFEATIRTRLEQAQLNADVAGSLVPLTLLSPLWPTYTQEHFDEDQHTKTGAEIDGRNDLMQALNNALGRQLNAEWFLFMRRFETEGTWDQRSGRGYYARVVSAGAVYVLCLKNCTWREDPALIDALEAIERRGVGTRCHQGFGRVVCFDPFITQCGIKEQKEESTMPEDPLRKHRKALVMAAEAAIESAQDHLGKWNKTQLPRLSAICGQAVCKEEIENYIRYQYSRTNGPWPREVGESVIAKIKGVVDELSSDAERVAAWRLYATYMTRAYTYRAASNKPGPQNQKGVKR